MALTIDQLTAITHKKIMPKMYDNISDSNILLKKIMNSGSYVPQDGGTAITIPLNYAFTSSAGWYAGSDTLNTSDNDSISAASFNWASVYANITISDEDELKNSGDAGAIRLLVAKSQIAERTIKDLMGTGLFSDGSDAKSIVGLRDIVATDQTVGGIDQSANSFWQGKVDSTTTTTTIAALQTQYENASIDNEKPNLGVCTRAIYGYYFNLLQPQQRFTDMDTAKGGFQNLMFSGVPIVVDSHTPSAHLFFLNLNHLFLYYHPQRNFTATPFAAPINQQIKVSRILWMGALGSSNNRLHAKFSALAA